MKKPNLIQKLRKWRISRLELLRLVDTLGIENERLKAKLAALQLAKDQAERHAEDRRREKEALRTKLAAQKKALETQEILVEQLGTKIAELRDEADRQKSG